MLRARAVPNPAIPRQLRPVHLITDRAKRYRARRANPPGPKRCGFCGARNPRDIDHLDGNEGNGARRNLMRLCRSCNVRKGIVQARAGHGKRTRQYNPERVPTFDQYVDAVLVLRGDEEGDLLRAVEVLQATSDAERFEYVEEIAKAANPGYRTTYGEYARAVSIHKRGAHDEGGRIIHATPKDLRSEYARRFTRARKKHTAEMPPF